ncbi:MAG: HDOD domain-containing protein [Pseudomonadota bacterium]
MFSFFRRKQVDPRRELAGALGGAALPSFPAIQMQVLRELRQVDTPLNRIGDLVMRDPGLSTKVLSTVNSAGFGLKRRVDSVAHAVSLLGAGRLESVVLSVAVAQALPSRAVRGFCPRRFWRAAARRATTALALADLLHPASRSVAFTAGLLQDMAVPLLATHRNEQYGPVLEAWVGDGGSLSALERGEFGWSHAEVASWVASEWNFPEGLGYAIGGHHGSDEPELASPLPVRLVGLLGEEAEEDQALDSLIETARGTHDVPVDRVVQAVRRGFELSEEVAALYC